jgi:hypothetical protein
VHPDGPTQAASCERYSPPGIGPKRVTGQAEAKLPPAD